MSSKYVVGTLAAHFTALKEDPRRNVVRASSSVKTVMKCSNHLPAEDQSTAELLLKKQALGNGEHCDISKGTARVGNLTSPRITGNFNNTKSNILSKNVSNHVRSLHERASAIEPSRIKRNRGPTYNSENEQVWGSPKPFMSNDDSVKMPAIPFEDDPEKIERTLFVGNLPLAFTKKKLKNLFKKCGTVQSVRFRLSTSKMPKKIIQRRSVSDGRSHLIAYVVMAQVESVSSALALDGSVLDGHRLRVDLARNTNHDYKNSVFLGNLPYDVQENEIENFFIDCGRIKNVRIVRDSTLGIGKGFGYILFDIKDGVILALQKNGQSFKGRTLRVFPARNVKKREVPESQEGRTKLHWSNKSPGSRRRGHFHSHTLNYQGLETQEGRKAKRNILRKIRHPKRSKDNVKQEPSNSL